MIRKRRIVLVTAGLLIAAAIVPAWRVWREAKRGYATHHLIAAIKALNVETVRAYLDDGADPNVCDTPEVPPTFWQALKAAFLKRPLPFKQNVPNNDEEPKPEYPALFVALTPRGMDDETLSPEAKQRSAQIALLLLAHGAKAKDVPDPEHSNNQAQDNAPLHKAVEYQRLDLVQKLLEKGAAPHDCAVRYYTPLFRAVQEKDARIVEQLLAHGANPDVREGHYVITPLVAAIQEDHKANVQVLLRYKADVNQGDEYDKTALDYAQGSHQEDIVKMLRQAGASYEHTKSAALFRAIRRNDVKAVRKLLDGSLRGDVIDKAEANPPSALMVAIEMEYSRSPKYIGQPPRNNLAIVRELLSEGADIDHCNKYSLALKMARRHSSPAVRRLLEKSNWADSR